ncbi:methionyl-tRNA formyltransferase [Deferrisoma palaeochoriense]
MADPGPVVFLGTSAFALPALEALLAAGERVALVVTQPDRPRGRGRKLEPPPVKALALERGLPVFQPERVNAPEALERIGSLEPEFLVVVAYGQILGRGLLEVPRRGAVNLHPSLLPRHRGPSPVAWTILEGDDRAGVSTMLMDERMDAGPVLLQRSFPLLPQTTCGELEDHLARAGADLVVKTLEGLRAGRIRPEPQDEDRATYSRLIDRELRTIRWDEPARRVRARIHALSPRPGALTFRGAAAVKVLRAGERDGEGPPGTVVRLDRDGPVVACGRGAVVLLEVQPEGRRPMGGADWARGGGPAPGEMLGGGAG